MPQQVGLSGLQRRPYIRHILPWTPGCRNPWSRMGNIQKWRIPKLNPTSPSDSFLARGKVRQVYGIDAVKVLLGVMVCQIVACQVPRRELQQQTE